MLSTPALKKLSPARSFTTDERGNVIMIFALALPVVVGLVGLAIDYSRATLLRQHITAAADSTAIVATKAVAAGETVAAATDLAATYWKSNVKTANGHITPPAISITKVSGIVTATVDYQTSVDTTFGRITGVKSIPVNGTAVAQASSIQNATKSYSGSGGIWGDPHLVGADGHNTEFFCPRPSYYDMLSDGGLELNIRCQNFASFDLISDFSMMLGSHKIQMSSAMLDPKTMTMTAAGWTKTVTIDGTVYNPSFGTTELANWPEGTVTAVIDTQNYLQTQYSVNSNHIEIDTPHYKIVLGFAYANGYGSWGWTTISAKNAGTCGIPGGLFGQTLGGIDNYKMSDYAVPTATSTQSAFDRTPCPVLTASGVRLIK